MYAIPKLLSIVEILQLSKLNFIVRPPFLSGGELTSILYVSSWAVVHWSVGCSEGEASPLSLVYTQKYSSHIPFYFYSFYLCEFSYAQAAMKVLFVSSDIDHHNVKTELPFFILF